MLFLGVWFLFQLWQGGFDIFAPTGTGTGGVAFFAHLGGFVFGLLVGPVLAPEKASRPGVAARRARGAPKGTRRCSPCAAAPIPSAWTKATRGRSTS